MRKIALLISSVAAVMACAAFMAAPGAAELVNGHSAALAKADGLSTKIITVSSAAGRLQTMVDFAKPNLLRIDSPTQLVISDGTSVYTLLKSQNVYYKSPVNAESMAKVLGSDAMMPLRSFFNANALSGLSGLKVGTPINKKGVMLTPVTGNYGSGMKATIAIASTDGVARQIEIGKVTGTGETMIADFTELVLARPAASKFTFTPPAGAKEISEADLMSTKWFENYDEAMAEAKRTNRPILLDFYTDWCHYCHMLDEEVYTTEIFKNKARSFVLLKINPEKDPGKTYGFEVEGFPTILFLNTSGQKIHEVVGYMPADRFVGEMDKALGK